MIIAIDGPAGSGKSTVARQVARRLGAHYLDTGAMYRAVAWAALDAGLDLEDEVTVSEMASTLDIRFIHAQASAIPSAVEVDGVDVSEEIRTPRIDQVVSAVAKMSRVRSAMVPLQRAEASRGDLVAEGRDIGTVVFPDADLKVFLTASEAERARRRHLEQIERGSQVAEETVRELMAARDTADSSRATAPLIEADDAWRLDTTGMSIEQVVDAIVRRAAEVRP